jgi:hypothetical protein
MNFTSKHTSNHNGRGGVKVTATVQGKARQVTSPWDHSISRLRNHGRAMAAFANKHMTQSDRDQLNQSSITGGLHYDDQGDTVRWTWDN